MSNQKRIYQIAKELNISHVEIIKFLKSKNIEVANHMAPVDNNIYDSILMEFSKEKATIERVRKERARKAIIEHKEEVDTNVDEPAAKEDIISVQKNIQEEKKEDVKDSIKDEEVSKEDISKEKEENITADNSKDEKIVAKPRKLNDFPAIM